MGKTSVIFPGLMLLVFIGVFVFQKIEEKNRYENDRRSILQLIRTRSDNRDYEAVRRFAEGWLVVHPDDAAVIDLYDDSTRKLSAFEPDTSRVAGSAVAIVPSAEMSAELRAYLSDLSKKIDRLSAVKYTAANHAASSDTVVLPSDRKNVLTPEMLRKMRLLVNEGIEAYGRFDLVVAKKRFSEVLKLDDLHVLANTYLGATLYRENPSDEKNVKTIIKCCQTAIRNDSSIGLAHLTLARVYASQGMTDLALNEYREVFVLDPLDEETVLALGKLHYAKGNTDEGIKYLSMVLKQKPDSVDAYYYLALCHEAKNDTAGAIRYLKIACDKDYGHYAAVYRLGELSFKTGVFDTAEIFLVRATRIKSTSWDAYLMLGEIYYSRKRFDAAKTVLETIKTKNPSFDRMARVDELLGKMENS
jgi:tetratricopeptide (TPR) repeat protein